MPKLENLLFIVKNETYYHGTLLPCFIIIVNIFHYFRIYPSEGAQNSRDMVSIHLLCSLNDHTETLVS